MEVEIEIGFKSIGRGWVWGVLINLSHPLISSTKGGGQYQGGSAADKAMVALGPNRLLGYGGVGGLRIPP